MDIELLSKIIGELILKHDQVGLPGIGTFVAEMVPASFSDKGYTINPPYRRLSFFSANLEEDVLVDFYSSSNNLDREATRSYLTHYFSDLKAVLLERRTLVFPGLGRMRTTKDDKFFFVPNEDLDIFPEGFGLAPVSLKTHIETPEEIAISVSNLANIMDVEPEVIIANAQETAPNPELIPEPEPLPAKEETVQEPAPEPEPVPEPEPEPELIAVPEPEKEQESKPEEEGLVLNEETLNYEPEKKKKKKFNFWVFLLVLIGIAFFCAAVFMILAVVAPDFVDSLLYTPEELRIINY